MGRQQRGAGLVLERLDPIPHRDHRGGGLSFDAARSAALDCLAGIAQAEPESASEVCLIAQDDDGNPVGETVFASSVSVPA